MKTVKKSISLLLCLCMLMSVAAVGLTAFAAEKTTAVTALEEKISAFEGNMNTAEPSEADLAAYNELIAAYTKLSAAEKESMDIVLFDKLYHKITDWERQVSIKENPTIASSNKQHRINAHKKVNTVLNGQPSYLTNASVLSDTLKSKTVSTADKKAAFAAADENTRAYAGAWYASYESYYYTIDKYLTKAFETLVSEISAQKLKDSPFDETAPARLKKPKPADYPNGEQDAQYIEDYAAYWTAEDEYYSWQARQKDYKAAFDIEAMEEIVQIAPEFKPMLDTAKQLLAAKKAFDADQTKTQDALNAVEAYEALTGLDALRIKNLSYTLYHYAVGTIYWTVKTRKAVDLYSDCSDIKNLKYVDEFVEVVESISLPYTRADIVAVKEAYEKVPASLVSSISDEITQKYKDILASIAPDEAVGDKPDVESMATTEVKYPLLTGKKTVTRSIDSVGDILFALLGLPEDGLVEMLKTGFYTNEMVGTIATNLFPLVGGLSSLIEYGPNDLAVKLTEEKFAGAAAVLAAAATKDESGKVVKDLKDWEKVSFKNGDWGFQDGDREGFLDATAAMFRALSLLTLVITFENQISTTGGTYTYGAYEDLVPIFEALELRGYLSSHEYTNYVSKAASNEKMDFIIRPILVPICNLLDDIAADPLNGILDLLPKVGMLLKDDLLDTQIQKLVGKIKMVSIPEFSLTTESIFDMIAPALSGIELKAAEFDENGNEISPAVTLSLTLQKEKFVKLIGDLAGCGTYVARESVVRGQAWYVGIDSDKTDAFMVLFSWLHSELTETANITAIKEAINGMGLGTIALIAVGILLDIVASSSVGCALFALAVFMPFVKILLIFAGFVGK